MKITLTESEMLIAQIVGRLRHINDQAANVQGDAINDQMTINIDGVIGEMAFAKWQNKWPDLNTMPRKFGRDGTIKNIRYDIKTTRLQYGNLLATMKVNVDVDVYILGIIAGNTVDFVGHITKEKFIRPENIRNLGHGDCYFYHQKKLKRFNDDLK